VFDSLLCRIAAWLGAAACLAWAFGTLSFRDAEGVLRSELCLALALAGTLILAGLAKWLRASAFWFALALGGQAVALQMIDAGTRLHYQHYKPIGRLLADHPLLVSFLAAQTILVVCGLLRGRPALNSIRGGFRWWQLGAVALTFFLTSATVSREVPAYVAELFFAAFVQAVNLGNILVAVWVMPEGALTWLKSKADALAAARSERLAWAGAVWVAALAAALSFFVYQRHPHVADEVVYLYHAKYLAAGKLTLPAPPAPAAFNVDLMHYEPDRSYSPVPPGWPAMLAVGFLAGVPWLVNPLLAGANVLLAYWLLREIYDTATARAATLLLCVSPWHVFMAMNFMTHTFTLTCALCAALAVARARATGRVTWGLAGGAAAAGTGLIRPLEGLIVAGLLGLWSLGFGGRRLRLSSLAGLVLGFVGVSAVVLPYNKLLTGSSTVFPIMAYMEKYYGPKTNALGFGPERGLGWPIDPFPGHGPLDALVNANLNFFSVNTELLGWSAGSMLAIALLVFSGAMRGADYRMAAVIAAVVGIHALYWFSGGPDFGARYWFLILVPGVALAARGLQVLRARLEASGANGTRVLAAAVSLCVLALVNYFPWRVLDKYQHYLNMRPEIRDLARRHNFGRSLVLVRGDRYPDYASAAVYNPVDLRADEPVYAWDRSPEARGEALAAYSDRPVWIVNGPSVTRAGFQVAEGPLPAATLLADRGEKREVAP